VSNSEQLEASPSGEPSFTTGQVVNPAPRRLWRDHTFVTYWLASSIDLAGSQVTYVAMPLVAVIVLKASASDTGILRALSALPSLMFGILAGALVDRIPRRRILIASNIASALLLASVPVAATAHRLALSQVFVVTFLVGVAGVFGGIAATAYLPTLVRRDALVDANGKLAATSSSLSIIGPSMAGALIQWLTAPIALAADAVLTVLSAIVFVTIRRPEALPRFEERRMLSSIWTGIREAVGAPILRMITLVVSGFNLFSAMAQAVFVLYMARQLKLPATTIGLIFAAAGPGALVGSVLSRRFADSIGLGQTIVLGTLAFGLGWIIAPIAAGPVPVLVASLMASQFMLYAGAQLANVNIKSLRQVATPPQLLGRVSGIMALAWQGVVPIGAIVGGYIGQIAGPRTALTVASIASLTMMVLLFLTPLRRVRCVADVAVSGETPV
jgi:MFS family permease